MTDAAYLPPLLLGLFRHLARNGVPVGVRDYLDGLRALELGVIQPDRIGLRELALTLWARSDVERRLIARWFETMPPPAVAAIEAIEKALAETELAHRTTAGEVEGQDTTATASAPEAASLQGSGPASRPFGVRARLSFSTVREGGGGGVPVPTLAADLSIGEQYVLSPHAVVSQRELAVLWRRYRRGTRRGPATELDVPASIRERCRQGLLRQPVLRARRGNNARLLVLADVSPSMDPWRPFLATLAESLPLGRLAAFELLYFANLPRKELFATQDLTHPDGLEEVLRRNVGASLLVVSDAGSARGNLNRRRFAHTARFLEAARKHFASLVWWNPMPKSRWSRTTAALVASAPGVTMLPLDTSSLLRGIDTLRGKT